MSTHSVEVVEINNVFEHPNADKLEMTEVNGWQVVTRAGDFRAGDKAVYVEPDYVVPTDRKEFSFLAKEGKTSHRLKAIRLRGQLSFGLLIPLPEDLKDSKVGDNVMEKLGIERYEPPIKMGTYASGLSDENTPDTYSPKFDVENYKKFKEAFKPGEEVIVTEKVHGANARFLFTNGTFYMGSRNRWLLPEESHLWSLACKKDSRIMDWCIRNPDIVLYGEIYGPVQSLRYGVTNTPDFVAFAALQKGVWLNSDFLIEDDTIPTVPVLYRGPFGDHIFKLAEKDSVLSKAEGQLMEGIVIVPVEERFYKNIGRLALKYISNRYWEYND